MGIEMIVGAVVSLLVQWLKGYSTNQYVTLAILLVVSIAASGIYTALVVANLWTTVATVLVTAGAFYSFVIARFQSTTP